MSHRGTRQPHRGFVINGAALQCLAYWLYYLTLETFAGLTWGVCVATPLWISATLFRAHVHNAWAWALVIHVLSWYMQIHPGHAILEGRKPALLDSFFQVGAAVAVVGIVDTPSTTEPGTGAAVCVV